MLTHTGELPGCQTQKAALASVQPIIGGPSKISQPQFLSCSSAIPRLTESLNLETCRGRECDLAAIEHKIATRELSARDVEGTFFLSCTYLELLLTPFLFPSPYLLDFSFVTNLGLRLPLGTRRYIGHKQKGTSCGSKLDDSRLDEHHEKTYLPVRLHLTYTPRYT